MRLCKNVLIKPYYVDVVDDIDIQKKKKTMDQLESLREVNPLGPVCTSAQKPKEY